MTTKPVTIRKKCQHCEREFTTNREKAKFCSDRCRVYSYRAARGIQTKQDHLHTICERSGCGNNVPTSTRSDTKYCSNACRQKVYNQKNAEKVKAEYAKKAERERAIKAAKEAELESERIADEFLQELIK